MRIHDDMTLSEDEITTDHSDSDDESTDVAGNL